MRTVTLAVSSRENTTKKTDTGQIVFPFDALHVHFMFEEAA